MTAMNSDVRDAIVVGSGAGGLTAAAVLAAKGRSVLVLEAAPVLGGYLNPFEWKGYRFDTGLHYLGELRQGGSFRKLLERIGLWDRITMVELDPKGFGEYHLGDLDFVMPADRDLFRERLLDAVPERRADVDRYFDVLADVERSVAAASNQHDGFLAKLKMARHLPTLMKHSKATYGEILDEITDDVRLKALLSLFSGEIGLPPSKASSFSGFLVVAHYLRGAFYPRGGGGSIRDAAVAVVEEGHGELRKRFRVERISRAGSLFEVVGTPQKADGSASGATERMVAKTVVFNADPKVLVDLADSSLGLERITDRARSMEPSVGAFYAFVGTDLDLRGLGVTGRNLMCADSVDVESTWRSLLSEQIPEQVASFMVSIPSLKDSEGKYAPDGKYALEVLTMARIEPWLEWAGKQSRRRGEEYDRLKNELGHKLLEQVDRCVLPGLTEHLDFVEFATPLSNQYWVNAPAGGCYGPDQIPAQMGMGRFRPVTPADGFYLAGAGVLGGGVFPAMRSGEIAGRKASAYLDDRRS
ncbi:MAG: NAD(P)/FAD-dependent oxidoreductase [Deltaproteobacteria bacterium]|nr:NAD(P)/FAD-dependent oxidoreductase [Deltaproteobacteria bacterium]